MKIDVLPSGLIQTIGYLLTEPALGEAVLVDAPGGIWEKIQPLLAKEGCKLKELWLTHGHWDHTQDAAQVAKRAWSRVLCPSGRRGAYRERRRSWRNSWAPALGLEAGQGRHIGSARATALVVLGREFEVRHVPGLATARATCFFMSPKRASRSSATPCSTAAWGVGTCPGQPGNPAPVHSRTNLHAAGRDRGLPGHGARPPSARRRPTISS